MKKNEQEHLLMNKKAFTVIELLAVIVILAIITLIATPIMLNIIKNSKDSSNKISIEKYGRALETAIYNYELVNKNLYNLTIKNIEPYIEYTGNKVECDITDINRDRTVYLERCKVNNKEVEFTYGKNQKICRLVYGTSKEVGAEYTCSLDEQRTFYVLENNSSSDEITLLMNRNYYTEDNEVPKAISWCKSGNNNSCNHDGLNPYIEKVQTKFGNSVIVGIPSAEQILAVNEYNIDSYNHDSISDWLYNYLKGTSNPVDDAHGYWTSTPFAGYYNSAWYVFYLGHVRTNGVGSEVGYGLRPTIILPKDLLD